MILIVGCGHKNMEGLVEIEGILYLPVFLPLSGWFKHSLTTRWKQAYLNQQLEVFLRHHFNWYSFLIQQRIVMKRENDTALWLSCQPTLDSKVQDRFKPCNFIQDLKRRTESYLGAGNSGTGNPKISRFL